MSEITVVEKFVGIDISKNTLDVCIDPDADDGTGIEGVCQRLKAVSPTLIVVEATGGLETRLASELAAQGLNVAVINPRQARDFAKARGNWRRPTGSTPPCWRPLPRPSSHRCAR